MAQLRTKMVNMGGKMVEVKVCPPSRRKAASSIQRKDSPSQRPIRMDKRPGKDALSFVRPLVAQVQKHLSLVPLKRSELARRSILDGSAFEHVLDYMLGQKLAAEVEGGVISGVMALK